LLPIPKKAAEKQGSAKWSEFSDARMSGTVRHLNTQVIPRNCFGGPIAPDTHGDIIGWMSPREG